MMGLGYLGNGGSSSSSSNLSASAPPFTVDQSNSKSNSNPLIHFTEPPYAVPFQPSFHNWQYTHSSASRPDLYSNLETKVDSIRTTCLPSANDYGYLDSHSVSPPSTHIPTLNPNVSAAADTFTFLQYSSNMPSNLAEAKPYCPSFVSPLVDAVPLVALKEPTYDFLSVPGVAPLDGTSQVDYTQSLSGLEYKPQWGSFWNRLADDDQAKRTDRTVSFCSEETNDAGSSVYSNYMKQGPCTAEDLSKCVGASAFSYQKLDDGFGRESQTVSPSIGKLNDKSFSLQDPRFISCESSKTSISGMNSTFAESHAHVPFLESATNFWSHQNPYTVSYDKCSRPLDSRVNKRVSVKKASPALVIRPPPIGTSSAVPNVVASEDVNSIGNAASINCKEFSCHNFSSQKDLLPSLSGGKESCLYSSRPSLCVERSDHVFIAPSSRRKDELSNTRDGLDHLSKSGIKFQHPDINVPDCLTLALDSAQGFTSLGDSSESVDHYYPTVDSPCWKGAPASRFSPCEISEAATAQHLMKKLDACNSLYFQQTPLFSSCTDEPVKVSTQNLGENGMNQENGYVELGSLLCPERLSNANGPTREHSLDDTVKAGLKYPKPSNSNEAKFSKDLDNTGKECDVPNGSKIYSDLESSQTIQPGHEKSEFISEREFKLCADVVDAVLNTHDASEDGSAPFHCVNGTSCSAEDVNKHVTEPAPKMNVQILVNTINNLSELLLFHCLNDASAVPEQDHEALKHVINNLRTCVSKKVAHNNPTQESMLTDQGTLDGCKNFLDLHKPLLLRVQDQQCLLQVVNAGGHPMTKKATASPLSRFDRHSIHVGNMGKRTSSVSGKEVENFADFVSFTVGGDIVKDDNKVQAIKKVLKEDFDGGAEMQSETLLYKNLWLEAEAALCSISYRARFNRMKIEMEKFKLHESKDVTENNKAVEKQVNSKVSPDPNIIDNVTPEAEDIPMSDNCIIQDSPMSSTTNVVDDVEASVLARFDILKCRGENSIPLNNEGRRLAEVPDTGFASKKNNLPFNGDHRSEDESVDITVGSYSQYFSGTRKLDKPGSHIGGSDEETMKELHLCAADDHMFPSRNNNIGLSNQLAAGWCDGSSSDWEHVLKDEFACQN